MPTTSSNNITRTEASVDSLKFAHNRIVVIEQIITEEAWAEMMFLYGCRFALLFSNLFPNKQQEIELLLTKSAAEQGCDNNWYWQWWRFKWMYDDWDFVTNKVQRIQGISYEHYKCYMINNEMLTDELLNMVTDKLETI